MTFTVVLLTEREYSMFGIIDQPTAWPKYFHLAIQISAAYEVLSTLCGEIPTTPEDEAQNTWLITLFDH
jgi:hypothetical protein